MKRCFKCEEVKPLSEFYKDRSMADGHRNSCKACYRQDRREYQVEYRKTEAHRECVAAYRKTEVYAASQARTKRKRRAEHPERTRAKDVVYNAIQAGRLTPLPCFVCGKKAEAHHPDYDAPLDVVWLCPPHHREAHALLKKAA